MTRTNLETRASGTRSWTLIIGFCLVCWHAVAAAGGANVLLLADRGGAGTDALQAALEASGSTVTRVTPEYNWNGTNPPLAGFTAVVHLNGDTWWAPMPASAQTALVNFVLSGGGFVGGQWNGYERAINQQTSMNPLVLQEWPGPFNCGVCVPTWSVVAGQEGHPVMAGVPSSFSFAADGHSDYAAVEPSTTLMVSQTGGPAVLVRELGDGRVVNFAVAPNYVTSNSLQDPNVQQLYLNAVDWVGGSLVADVDVKPGSDKNPINLRSKGVIPVAILTESGFDATEVDGSSVIFAGASAAHGAGHLEDVDGDGDLDWVGHFKTRETDIEKGDTEAELEGLTNSGAAFTGSDSISVK